MGMRADVTRVSRLGFGQRRQEEAGRPLLTTDGLLDLMKKAGEGSG